jgi:GPH family glycoside/pentoside/hexuronide:cation symporter
MKKMSRKQLPWYALSGFGPGMLNLVIAAYLVDALSTAGFDQNIETWTYANKTLVMTAIFSVLVLIAKVLDGLADIPLASLTDNLKTKWGKRRPAIILGFVPMLLSYILFCFPLVNAEHSIANTIWFGVLLILFYVSYTLTMVTYYGTFSEVTKTPEDRIYLSNWKAGFDTVQYSIGYALIPLFVGFANIRIIGLACASLSFTMAIAIFMIKEKSTLPKDLGIELEKPKIEIPSENAEQDVSFMESVKLTARNKGFMLWLTVLAAFYFGLQMFLTGQNVYASGPMGLESWKIAVMNTSAFAPVPIMLIIYSKVTKKFGFRKAFQTAIASFGIAMLMFSIAYVQWISSDIIRLVIGVIGGTIGSYGIGAFFSAPYMIPAEAAAEELATTGKSHPSMYFAMQGLFTALIGAISTSVIWLNIKEIVRDDNEFYGAHLMPYLVMGACVVAIVLAFFLPKKFTELGKKAKV